MGKSESETTSTMEPWAPAQPYLQAALGQAGDIYKSGGFAPDPYKGQRVAPFSSAANTGMGMIRQEALGGTPMVDTASRSMATLAGGRTPYNDMLNGDEVLRGLGLHGDATLGRMTRSDPRLASMMGGKEIYRDLDAVKASALGDAIPAAGAMFSGSGMLNSTTAMDHVGRAATEAVAPIEYGAWSDAQNRKLSAVGLDNQTRMNAALGNAGLQMDAIGQNADMRLGAAGLRQAGMLGAAGMAPGLQAAGYLPGQMLGQVGAMQDGRQQAMLDARMAAHNEGANPQAQEFERLLQSLMGLGGMGGTQSGTAPGQSMGEKIGGAGLGGLGMYGALAMNPATAPFALAGGGLSALMGLM